MSYVSLENRCYAASINDTTAPLRRALGLQRGRAMISVNTHHTSRGEMMGVGY